MALMLDEEMDENVTTIKVIGVGGGGGNAEMCIRDSNWAKCALSGEKYIGGIVGQGTDSDLTDGSLIAINNRAIVSVLEGQQYVGAVSGGQDGDFYGNLFVSDDLQGIDRLSRVGQAEPVTYETLLAQENLSLIHIFVAVYAMIIAERGEKRNRQI